MGDDLLSAIIVVYNVDVESGDAFFFNEGLTQMSVYKIISYLKKDDLEILAQLLSDRIFQKFYLVIFDSCGNYTIVGDELCFDCWVIKKSLIHGVTNNLSNTIVSIIEDQFGYKLSNNDEISTSEIYIGNGVMPELSMIYNPLIQNVEIFDSFDLYKKKEFCVLDNTIQLPNDDLLLEKFSNDHMLSLNLMQMKAIRDYFFQLNRHPTQIELEMLAQSWSEHCKHNIFSAEIDDIKDGLYKHYIKGATEKISKTKYVSVFSDNAGAISFNEKYAVAVKVETHNSPSALEPCGGAMTGVLGVNRDIIGFGLGALPISNHYAFCFSDEEKVYYRDKNFLQPILKKENIENGVTKGVKIAGNHSGIPTTNGIVYYGTGFVAKPLVFVGTVGIIPIDKCFKDVQNGDLIVIIGGKTGKDGIHGATFSSENLNNISSTVVQIGDAFTQKKFCDALIKEARDLNLYNAITDNGAGGFSSSIGEMGKDGFVVNLEKAKLKFPNMKPWEIWISESQERMTLSVPEKNYQYLEKIMQKHDVEIFSIGQFNKSGKAIVKYHDKILLNLDTWFIHEGNPKMKLISEEISDIKPFDYHEDKIEISEDLLHVLSHKNIKTRRKFAHIYDHEVQGITVLKPLQGKGKVFADTTILKPIINSYKGIVQSQSLGVFYENISKDGKSFFPCNHPYFFTERTVETAIRNLVTAGVDIEQVALLDNFCWSNFNNDFPYNKKRLWQLKVAAQACHDVAVFFKIPFISGKDSMFNNATLYDIDGNVEYKSNFPVLLITSIGIIDDINHSVSLDAKIPGDLLYVIGNIDNVNTNKHYLKEIFDLYNAYYNAVSDNIIASGIAVNFGGVLVAVAKKLIGGLIGADIDFENNLNLKYKRFPGIVVTIDCKNEEKFKKIFNKVPHFKLGILKDQTNEEVFLNVKNSNKYSMQSLRNAYDILL